MYSDIDIRVDEGTMNEIKKVIVLHVNNRRSTESVKESYKRKMRKKDELDKELEKKCENGKESPNELVDRIRKNCKKIQLKNQLEIETKKLYAEIRARGLYDEGLIAIVKELVKKKELEERKRIKNWIENEEMRCEEEILKEMVKRNECGEMYDERMIKMIYYYNSIKKLVEELEQKRDNYRNAMIEINKERRGLIIKEEDWRKVMSKIMKK